VARPRPDEGSGWLRGTQLVLMTSAGRLLSGAIKDRDGLAPALRLRQFRVGAQHFLQRRGKPVAVLHPPSEEPAGGGHQHELGAV